MEKYQEAIARIRQVLAEHQEGMSITDIADAVGVNRNAVAKFMDILQVQGAVDGFRVGTSKIYFLTSRLPVSSVPRICTRPFLVLDKNGQVTDTSPAFAGLAGLPRDKVIGKELGTLPVTVSGSTSLMAAFRSAIRGAAQGVSGRVMQGTVPHYSGAFLFQPVVFDNGKPGVALILDEPAPSSPAPAGGSGASPDGTPLALLDEAREYVVWHTADGTIRFVNGTYCEAAGKARDELIGRPFRPLVIEEDALRLQDHRRRLTPQNPAGTIEFRAIMADGDVRWQSWKERALFSPAGELVGYHSFGMDITETVSLKNELWQAREAQREAISGKTGELREINRQLYAEIAKRDIQEEHLFLAQSALDHAALAVFLVGNDSRIHLANRFAADLLGYSTRELLAMQAGGVFPDYGSEGWNACTGRADQEGSAALESPLISRDHTRIPAEVIIAPLTFRGIGFLCLAARVKKHPP